MRILLAIGIAVFALAPGSALAVQKEIFGLTDLGGAFHITRYDVTGGAFQDCGLTLGIQGGYTTNLAMNNNRRLYYMNPNDNSQVIYQADLNGSNQLINQQALDTLNPGLGTIDGFTVGPDQNLYMTGYGGDKIFRYDVGSNSHTASTEVTLVNGGQVRSDLAFDPLTGYLVGMGFDPAGRLSLFQFSGALATNGVNDNLPWEYFGGNTSPWAGVELRAYLGLYPDGVAFDPTNGDLYMSGDGEKFSIWNRATAQLISYLPPGGPDSLMGTDLAFQTVPEPSGLLLLGLAGLAAGRRRR